MPLSKTDLRYVHITGRTTFGSLLFSRKPFCGHNTFVLQMIVM